MGHVNYTGSASKIFVTVVLDMFAFHSQNQTAITVSRLIIHDLYMNTASPLYQQVST